MLPEGPISSSYSPPYSPPKTAKDLAISVQAMVDATVKAATDLQPATMSIGCDGLPIINALDGTACAANNGVPSGPMILFNQATRSVVGATPGRSFQSSIVSGFTGSTTIITLPQGCPATITALAAKRRYLDTVGNLFAPDGTWISSGNAVAAQSVAYDFKVLLESTQEYLRRLAGNAAAPTAALAGLGSGNVDNGAHSYAVAFVDSVLGNLGGGTSVAITIVDKTVNGQVALTNIPIGPSGTTSRVVYRTVIGFATFRLLTTLNDNSTTTYTDNTADSSISGNATWTVPTKKITAETPPMVSELDGSQAVSPYTHFGGVCRGAVPAANACIQRTDDVLFSMEANYPLGDSIHSGSHGITVRNPNTMVRIGRLALQGDGASYNWTARGQRIAVSSNAEGFWFVNMYDAGLLSAPPPVPYPGIEFGAFNAQQMNRNIARISLDKSTYTPKIEELVLLQNKGTAWGVNDYAIGISLP